MQIFLISFVALAVVKFAKKNCHMRCPGTLLLFSTRSRSQLSNMSKFSTNNRRQISPIMLIMTQIQTNPLCGDL